MKAAILYGVNEPLKYEDTTLPVLAPGQALVQVRAAALNHRDVWIQHGQYAGLRFPIILGSDGAGVLHSLAGGTTSLLAIGAEVLINPSTHWGPNARHHGPDFKILGLPENGTLAEYVAVQAENLHPKPAHLSWEQAAALPLAGLTAWRALVTRGQVQPGQRVFIPGIGGGVALFALQFAVALGAEVWVSSSSDDKLARAKALGAAGGINYREADWAKTLKKTAGDFPLIIDSVGGSTYPLLVDLAAMGGRIVTFGGTAGAINGLVPGRYFWKHLDLLGTTMGSPDDFAGMLEAVNTHRIVPVVDSVLPLAQAQQAFDHMHAGGQFGKLVLAP